MVRWVRRGVVDCGVRKEVSGNYYGFHANSYVGGWVVVQLVSKPSLMVVDPEGFNHLLRAQPYHADTLLQLAEVYSHREGATPGSLPFYFI